MMSRRHALRKAFVSVIGSVLVGWGVIVLPASALSSDEITIGGNLPRDANGVVDIGQIQDIVVGQFAGGAPEVRFRGFSLTPEETHELFLSLDGEQNALRRIGEALPADGVERQVKLRGLADGQRIEGRVKRQEDGTL